MRDRQRLRRRVQRRGDDLRIIDRLGPAERGRSARPSTPSTVNRSRHLITVGRDTPSVRAAPDTPVPSATQRTIKARSRAPPTPSRTSSRPNVARSRSLTASVDEGMPQCHAPPPHEQRTSSHLPRRQMHWQQRLLDRTLHAGRDARLLRRSAPTRRSAPPPQRSDIVARRARAGHHEASLTRPSSSPNAGPRARALRQSSCVGETPARG